jgi:hypothetical protein
MNSLNSLHSKVTTGHQAKLAYVYLRQSSPGQVLRNAESTVAAPRPIGARAFSSL